MRNPIGRWLAICLLLEFAAANPLRAQTKVAKADGTSQRTTALKVSTDERSLARQHPLWPALELAVGSYQHIRRNVRDYSCTVVRRERVNGTLQDHEYMAAKVRHRRSRDGKVVIPFAVYLKVLAPAKVQGREVLFVEGENDGDMLVRNGGKRFAFVTTKIRPDSDSAMAGNRYPLTEFGFENLVKRLIEVVQEDIRFNAETVVEFFNDASIDGRSCTGVRVTHPTYDERLRFHTATVFLDNELKVPVHYEAHGWPAQAGGEPTLLEQYTYRDIDLNVGYSDRDFDAANPAYRVK